MPWARWEYIALPKSLGGWGLKNIFQFLRPLVAKVGQHNYISPCSLFDWIRTPKRRESRVSLIWKAIMASLDVIRGGLSWKVGNGRRVYIGIDPWPGSNLS